MFNHSNPLPADPLLRVQLYCSKCQCPTCYGCQIFTEGNPEAKAVYQGLIANNTTSSHLRQGAELMLCSYRLSDMWTNLYRRGLGETPAAERLIQESLAKVEAAEMEFHLARNEQLANEAYGSGCAMAMKLA